MNIYKLQYKDKETAMADLLAKKVYIETEEGLSYGSGVQAVVEIGKIVLEDGTYNEDGEELTAPVFAEGYHYDIMSEQEIVSKNEIVVNNPKHTFAGY